MPVTTTFPAVRRHLEEAYRLLGGNDELSERTRQALDILIDALLAAEYRAPRRSATIIDFPAQPKPRKRGQMSSQPTGK